MNHPVSVKLNEEQIKELGLVRKRQRILEWAVNQELRWNM